MLSETRTVVGTDGRTWTIRRDVEVFWPYGLDDFEHDLSPRFGLWASGLMIVAAWAALFYWFTPTGLIQLAVTTTLAVLVPLAYAGRWCAHRPWTLVAETPGTSEHNAERWVALVRGFGRAKEEFELVSRAIRLTGTPEFFSGPFHPVS